MLERAEHRLRVHDLTNARIDSVLKLLKEARIDTDAIIREATTKKNRKSS